MKREDLCVGCFQPLVGSGESWAMSGDPRGVVKLCPECAGPRKKAADKRRRCDSRTADPEPVVAPKSAVAVVKSVAAAAAPTRPVARPAAAAPVVVARPVAAAPVASVMVQPPLARPRSRGGKVKQAVRVTRDAEGRAVFVSEVRT